MSIVVLERVSWARPVRFGRYLFPRRVQATVGVPPDQLVHIDVAIVDGLPACVALTKHRDGPPLSGEVLRRLPVGRIVREIATRVAQEADGQPDRLRTRSEARHIGKSMYRPQRGHRLTDAHLQAVASVYSDAYHQGQRPTKAVAEHFTVARSTAGRWVVEARKRGFLSATRERMARA